MVGVMGAAADTDAQADYLFTSMQQSFVRLRRGTPGAFPPPVDDMDGFWNEQERIMVEHTLQYAVVGGPQTIRRRIADFLALTKADELIVSMPVYDMDARLKSVRLFAGAQRELAEAA
jgi:alkanesulfonate monooxygenase SsuD/methylene tetrahydromethanopterin reductase-like flavin-dependent oxidoreductase (luciferase family)